MLSEGDLPGVRQKGTKTHVVFLARNSNMTKLPPQPSMENVVAGCTHYVILNADSEDFSVLRSQLRLGDGLAGSNPVEVVSLPIPVQRGRL